jgi:hypothetical protein
MLSDTLRVDLRCLRSGRQTSVWRAGLLGVLLLLSLSQATHAILGIYLRAAVVSWDSPISQQQDELASQSLPWADSFAESLAHARAAAGLISGLNTLPADPEHASLALSSGITRSPPAA